VSPMTSSAPSANNADIAAILDDLKAEAVPLGVSASQSSPLGGRTAAEGEGWINARRAGTSANIGCASSGVKLPYARSVRRAFGNVGDALQGDNGTDYQLRENPHIGVRPNVLFGVPASKSLRNGAAIQFSGRSSSRLMLTKYAAS
jgi:hypothetical protein